MTHQFLLQEALMHHKCQEKRRAAATDYIPQEQKQRHGSKHGTRWCTYRAKWKCGEKSLPMSKFCSLRILSKTHFLGVMSLWLAARLTKFRFMYTPCSLITAYSFQPQSFPHCGLFFVLLKTIIRHCL